MSSRRSRRVAAALVGAVALAMGSCTPATSDGGEVVVTTDDRIDEVRDAREALATPVPTLVAEAERLLVAVEEVWRHEAASDQRADLADALQLAPFRSALDDLDEVELDGVGPDVAAATEVVDQLVEDGRTLLDVVEEELASLAEVPPADAELEDLLERWDERGSYSQQLTSFEETVTEAEALAERLADRSGVPACVELWPRRAEAARTVAERSEELRVLVRDRRGQEFDELRDQYRQDPYGVGALLGVLDAEAASCWPAASAAPPVLVRMQAATDDLATALDPPDLRG